MRSITLDSLVRVAVCALGVGLLVRVLCLISERVLRVQVPRAEAAMQAAAVVGLLAGFQYTRDYWLATKMSAILVGGSFLLRWIMAWVTETDTSKSS